MTRGDSLISLWFLATMVKSAKSSTLLTSANQGRLGSSRILLATADNKHEFCEAHAGRLRGI